MQSLKATLTLKLNDLQTKRKNYNALLADKQHLNPNQRRAYIHARNFVVKQIENCERKLKAL